MDLVELREIVLEKTKKQRQYKELLKEQEQTKEKLLSLEGELKKEFKDLQRIQGVSLYSILYGVFGSKEKRILKERQDYLKVKLNYDHCKELLDEIESASYRLNKEIISFGEHEKEYESRLQRLEEELQSKSDKDLHEMKLKLAAKASLEKELNEAYLAGKNARQEINVLIRSLESARKMGTFDMIAGGIIATAVKHSRIDNSKKQLSRVQFALSAFQKELKEVDLGLDSNLGIELKGFHRFADYFLDNIIVDWSVQNKIIQSYEKTLKTGKQVDYLLSGILKKMDTLQHEQKELNEQKEQIIVQKEKP